MLPYYIMVLLPFLFSIVQFESQARQMISKKKNWPLLIFFTLYFLLLALRAVEIGADTFRYVEIYELVNVTDWADLANVRGSEMGYSILTKICSVIWDDPQFFLAVVALVTTVPIMILYFQESENSMVSMVLFITFPVFMMNFSGLRQGVAISIGVLAYYMTKKKRLIPFILAVLLAMSFHVSAFILFLMYPLYHLRFRKAHMVLVLPLYLTVYLLNDQIFRLVVPLLGGDYAEHVDRMTDTGAYTMIILIALFLLYSFIAPEEKEMDETSLGLRNLILCALALQLFVPLNQVAMRLNYYYILFVPLLIPRITNRFERVSPFIRNVINIVMVAFFGVYFFIKAANTDSLNIYPYIFFWQ